MIRGIACYGDRILTGLDNGSIVDSNCTNGYHKGGGIIWKAHDRIVATVLFWAPNRALSASFDGTVKTWNLDTHRRIWAVNPGIGPIYSTTLLNNNTVVVCGKQPILKIIDLESGKEVGFCVGHTEEVYDVVALQGGSQFASTSYDKSIIVWNQKGEIMQNIALGKVSTSLASSPCGQKMAVSLNGQVAMFHCKYIPEHDERGKWEKVWQRKIFPGYYTTAVTWNPRNHHIAVGSSREGLCVITAETGDLVDFIVQTDEPYETDNDRFDTILFTDNHLLIGDNKDLWLKSWTL